MSNALAKIDALASRFSGQLSFAAVRLDPAGRPVPGTELVRAPDAVFYPASLIKVLVMVEAFRQADAGVLDLTRPIPVPADEQVTGSGILKVLQPLTPLAVLDLITLMIVVSDNTATNLMIDLVGRDKINAFAHQSGLKDTFLAGKLQVPKERWTDDQLAGRRSTTTATDMLKLITAIYSQEAASSVACRRMINILGQQQYTHILGRFLPYDINAVEEGAPGIHIASKGGAVRGIRHEVGVITANHIQFAVALLTGGCQDLRYHVDNEAEILLAHVTRCLFDHYTAHAA